MTTLDLRDADDGSEWRLWQVQISDDTLDTNADTFPAVGQSSDKTFVSVLEELEAFSLTGLVTAPRLSGQTTPNSYNSDWRTALAEYIQRGEAFAQSAQGTGYTLQDRDRDRTALNVLIEDFTWTYEKGAVFQVSYELTLRRGLGVLPDANVSVGSATPQATGNVPALAGNNLDGFERIECSKRMELSSAPIAFGGAGENTVSAEGGMVREWSYSGRKSGTEAQRNSFDDTIRGLVDDSTKTFQTVMPGYSATVKAVDFESGRRAESGADSHEYSVTVRESR